jgi:hypothetical protein
LLWRLFGTRLPDDSEPRLWRECEPLAAVVIDLLPSYRCQGGMGQSQLLEGFDRGEVAQVMRWHAIEDERDAWESIAYCERAIRDVRFAQRQSAQDGTEKPVEQLAARFGF